MLDKLRKAPVVILTIGGSVSKNTIRDFSAILENRYTNTIQMDKLRFVCNTWKQVSDMTFVQNFTQPDFQATIFTPQKCVICDIFFLAN